MNKIGEAKTILPLPKLMTSFGLGELAKRSARCPFHDDRRCSFSVWQDGDGAGRSNVTAVAALAMNQFSGIARESFPPRRG